MPETAQLTVRLDLEGNLSSGIAKAQKQLGGLGRSVGQVGKGIGQVGAGFARAGLVVGGTAIAGLTAAANAAIDFEDAFAGVRKTVDEADLTAVGSSFDELARTFRDMATEIPIAATEFARLGEAAGALGVAASDIDEFVRTTALLGVTTDLTADQAADSLGRIGTILKFTGRDYEDFADSLVALGNAGASTESEIIEITKRFAAEADAAGLATTEIAGLASATASLGFAPERGGTALSRVFANLGTNISLANKKGKAFASLTGRSIEDLQKAIDSGDTLTIFTDFLEGLRGLSPTEANRVLKAAGITNTSDRTIFRAMAENLPFVNEQLGIAADATGALSEEATKRFDTVRSKLQLLRNNLVEAAITVGEGFAPAIGRAAEELSAFLKQDANKSELKRLGEDIGRAIDDVDWGEVLKGAREFVSVMKTALGFVMDILSAINKLPTEVKAAAAGLLVLNKASGGLIGAGVGNIAGGLAGAAIQGAASRAPGVGKLFAQPVYVVNFPPGFGTGAGGVAGTAGKAGIAGLVAAAVPLVLTAGTMLAIAEFVGPGLRSTLGVPDNGQASKPVDVGPLQVTFGGSQRAMSPNGQADLARVQEEQKRTNQRLESLRVMASRTKDDTVAAQNRVRDATIETQRETSRGFGLLDQTTRITTALQTGATAAAAVTTAFATQRGSSSIVGALYATRPQTYVNVNVNATTVTKSITRIERYGTSGGSRNRDSNGSGTFGNGGR